MSSGDKMLSGLWMLVTGGRKYSDRRHVYQVLDEERPMIVVQGECPAGGADLIAKLWCRRNGIPCIGMEAMWDAFGKRAGPIRNEWMLDFLPIHKVIAFPGDSGTENCVQAAHAREILVRDER